MTLIRFSLVLTLSFGGALFGCAAQQPNEPAASLRDLPPVPPATQSKALPYFQLARQSQPPKSNQYLLQAAAILIQDNYLEQARNILAGLDDDRLTSGQRIEKHLMLGGIALTAKSPDIALEELTLLGSARMENAQDAQRYHQIQAEAFAMQGKAPDEAWSRLSLDAYLTGAEREANLRRIEQLIASVTGTPAAKTLPAQPHAAHIQQLSSQLSDWMRRNDREAAPSLSESRSGIPTVAPPAKIAVLLPLKGPHAASAEAVRDGLMSEYYQRVKPHYDVELRFYDASDDSRIVELYQTATAEGARFVIGPLTKESVALLAKEDDLSVPVLALNYSAETSDEARLYQLGLSPEHEAEQAAERAIADGHQRAVVLAPNNAWGQRISSAFSERLQAAGGMVASLRLYDPAGADFSQPIREALELDLSDQRHRALQDVLSMQLKFTPRRRQDVDFIFVAAQPAQARLLRPQLKFHYAGELPVYSTSHIYTGLPSTQKDQDMNGMMFGDIPWVLEPVDQELFQSMQQAWAARDEKYVRLIALGIDAMALAGPLSTQPDTLTHHGETGILQLDEQRRLNRQVRWAQFKGGQPQLLPY
ncbi:MAG: penicillin-binding protein activator [Pseudomonadota bacterium]